MERKRVKIGGAEFYADNLPKVGNYIFRRKAVVKVCQRKNGTIYGKIVAKVNRLTSRGYYKVFEPDYAESYFDVSRSVESDPHLYEVEKAVKQKEFEEQYNHFYNEFGKPIYARDRREISAKFDEWMEKYPIFKIFVVGMAKRRGDMYTSDRECAAITRVWEERF